MNMLDGHNGDAVPDDMTQYPSKIFGIDYIEINIKCPICGNLKGDKLTLAEISQLIKNDKSFGRFSRCGICHRFVYWDITEIAKKIFNDLKVFMGEF